MKSKLWHSALTAVALFLFVAKVHGAEGEAARYVGYCKTAISLPATSTPNSTDAMNIGFCYGLMDGLRGANHFLKKSDPSSAFCEPATFNNEDLAKTFVAGVGANPELRELRGALAAQIAVRAAYPCKKGK